MIRYFLLLVAMLSVIGVHSQVKTKQEQKKKPVIVTDTTTVNKSKSNISSSLSGEALIFDYKIISRNNDTTFVDTTLTIKKEYRYNYLRKDNFNLMQFANTGQTYNTLSFDNASDNIVPKFAAQARHFNYMDVDDIKYYHVPTPLTDLYFKTVFSQGQTLDAFFTVNTSRQFNFSIAYKGLRSLGNYQNALTSTGNFRFTTNYQTRNGRYKMRGHIVMQDLLNQENGGLTDEDIQRFINDEEEIQDRSVFDPNFENAENNLEGKRFHLEQSYDILSKKDSIKDYKLSLVNTVSFEDKFYEYNQSAAVNSFFGDSFTNTIEDRVTLEDFYSDLGLTFQNTVLGKIAFKINYTNINYGYNSLVSLNNQLITNRIKEDFFGFNGSYKNQIGKFNVSGSVGANLSDRIKGNFLDANFSYEFSKNLSFFGKLNINNSLPNYNHLLYQSGYANYNWDNQNNFDTVKSQQLSFGIQSEKYLNAHVDISNIDNYTFFNLESQQDGVKIIKPIQYNSSIQYLRVKVQKEIRLGKFALDNTIMYQNVTSDTDVLNVPSLITRNTFYYTDEVFKKALKFQTGVIFNYFSEYNANGYDPLLAEFYTQNEIKIGGFPRLDFFINAKVRQTRIYLKAEHFNSSFTGRDYFSAPNYPYRDFTVRFGLVWNFFL
ncbi:putative beta-barrel porin [Winogradskyella wandonensis]|uniref:Putative beta-barrel porin n=1 Tax=Winogradskyella wandonensis TaxID=1442586 RepID=A0A4R1KM65_9FLAO|nr:putative porin [Winogradskyella wandonensis]TCK65273.1 putative beta-barrel porin [Winogradskyella wandonensis]